MTSARLSQPLPRTCFRSGRVKSLMWMVGFISADFKPNDPSFCRRKAVTISHGHQNQPSTDRPKVASENYTVVRAVSRKNPGSGKDMEYLGGNARVHSAREVHLTRLDRMDPGVSVWFGAIAI